MKPSVFWSLWLLATPFAGRAQTELFNFTTFDPAPSLGVQGAATFSAGRARLTPAVAARSGAVWFPTKRFLQEGFDTTFQFQLGNGREGLAFVVQNNPLPGLGRGGSGLGYEGVPNSLAVEFDVQSNEPITADFDVPHISVQSRGALPNSAAAPGSLASASAPALAGGSVHTARVRYVPGALDVFLDDTNTPLLSAPVTLTNLFGLENGQAWFGIVAANGAGGAAQDVINWSFHLPATPLSVALTSPLEGGSFLTPAVIDLEATAAGPDAVVQVEFFQGWQRLWTTNSGPYRFRWDTALPGPYTLTAVATDAAGRRITSQPVQVVAYPEQPVIGVNFTTTPGGTNFTLAPQAGAGVIPQHYWNNALMFTNGNGVLQNLRDASGAITPAVVSYDFVARGEEAEVNPDLSDDHRLMRAYGANTSSQSNVVITFFSIPFPIYDAIVYTDGANGGADRVAQVRAGANNVFVRDAAWTSFAGIYARGAGTSDTGTNTPAGNYVRLNAITTPSFTITNIARSASDGTPLAAINAIQIVPSIYDRNSPAFLTRGPYLQMGTPYSMMVRWRSNRPVTSRVQYGTNPNNLNQTLQNIAETQEHMLVLTNLQPDTRYYYAVGTTATNLARSTNLFFWTSPLTNKPTRIWVLGDSGTAGNGTPDRQLSVRDAFATVNAGRYVDLWLMLGDNAYNSGTDAEYQRAVFDIYTNTLAQSPLWPTIGNHETAQSHTPVATTPYLNIFSLPENAQAGGVPSGTERYYSFDYGSIHFICLDSMTNDRSTNGPMANWLRADLEANTNHWLIAFWHHPPYTKGSHDSDNNEADFELVEMRENINPILESYGVDLVMGGHSHCYERSYLMKGHYDYSGSLEPEMILNGTSGNPEADINPGTYTKVSDGTVYMVDGSSGQATFVQADWPHPIMYSYLLNLGSVVLDIDGNQLVGRFVRETGEIQDRFVIVKQTPPDGGTDTPRITSVTVKDGELCLVWTARPGTRYLVQRASNLQGASWQTTSETLTADALTHSWRCPLETTAPAAFYRITIVE